MPEVSKYENAATAFLEDYPVGSTVRPNELLDWATQHSDGLAPDLSIDDLSKKLSALRRHLNNGGASSNLQEGTRFFLKVEDAKRKTIVVRALSEHVNEQAEMAFDKSVIGAMSPLKSAKRAIEDVKLEEVPQERRESLQQHLENIVETAVPMSKFFSERVIDRQVKRLEAKGYSKQQARDIVELAPMLTRTQRLLKSTTW